MHWLIMHADQVIGEAAQMSANIKIQKTSTEVASNAEAMPRITILALAAQEEPGRYRRGDGGDFGCRQSSEVDLTGSTSTVTS